MRGAVMLYQNGFGGNDLAGGEEMIGGGGSQDTKKKASAVCVGVFVACLTIQMCIFYLS